MGRVKKYAAGNKNRRSKSLAKKLGQKASGSGENDEMMDD